MKPSRYRSSTKEAGSRRPEDRPDDEDRGLGVSSATVYHFSPEEAGPTGPRSRTDLPPDVAAGLAAYERALGIGSGSRPTDEDRGLAGTRTGVVTVPPEEAIRVGAQPRRQVPRLADLFLADVERSSHNSFDTQRTSRLLQLAVDKNRRLFDRSSPIAPCYRAAIAESLIRIHDILDARVQAAPRDRHGVPIVEGLHWDPEDPLERSLEAISPFSMRDPWEVIYRQETAECAREPAVERPQRRSRGACVVEAVTRWTAQRPASEPSSPFAPIRPGTRINLNASSSRDSCGRPLTYEWTMYSVPAHSRRTRIVNPNSVNQAYFVPDVAGQYRVRLSVRVRDNIPVTDIATINVGSQPPPPPPPDQWELPPEVHTDWLERARRDPHLSPAARQILIQYPNLHPEYLSSGSVRNHQRDITTINTVRQASRTLYNQPNSHIRRYLHQARTYEQFRNNVTRFRTEVQNSGRTVQNYAVRQAELPLTWCFNIHEQWHVPLQRNPHSVYYISVNF